MARPVFDAGGRDDAVVVVAVGVGAVVVRAVGAGAVVEDVGPGAVVVGAGAVVVGAVGAGAVGAVGVGAVGVGAVVLAGAGAVVTGAAVVPVGESGKRCVSVCEVCPLGAWPPAVDAPLNAPAAPTHNAIATARVRARYRV